MAQEFDVIVVGAGMSGATLACALGEVGFRVALLDKKPARVWQEQNYDPRVSSINLASQKIFESLGVWQAIQRRRVSPFREIRVWTRDGAIHFSANEISQTHLGHIIENSAITTALLEVLSNSENITVLQPTDIKQLSCDDHGVSVITEAHGKLHGSLLVGADGATSRVGEAADITKSIQRYGQKAIVATVHTEKNHAQTAWQRFLATGPLAFLPLADGLCSIVWSCDNAMADNVLALDDASFMRDLTEAFEYRLGAIVETSPRQAFPLARQDTTSYIGEHTVLIGDAAHVIHPLAGLGANLGITDAACLAQVLSAARGKKRDIGAHATLRRYERWRKGDNALVSNAMDMYKNIFGSSSDTLRRVAGSGLNLANRISPVKHTLMRHATGISGDLPDIARQSTIH
ncbi:MAG: UbiH/UbiF/VisC/COQ6 family ubiquinone biosynthesis hydroxylase [Gammaproteobacteria bacterium]|nr:UbiH/UbiF/VisC/COQ6 family ubiquinone biosynthesis hydroxylase [Gammaproteobacteria bacterium]